MKLKRGRLLWTGVAVATVAVFTAIVFRHRGVRGTEEPAEAIPVVAVRLAKAVERPMRGLLPTSGRVEPLPGEETDLSPPTSGIVTAVYVKEGDWVKDGQPVVQLNGALQTAALQQSVAQLLEAKSVTAQSRLNVVGTATDVDGEIASATSALRTAKLQLAQAQEEARAQPQIASAAVDQAKAELQSAQQELARLHAGARPEEVHQAEAAANRAAAVMQAAKTDMDRTARLVEAGVKPGKDLQDAKTAFATAQADYDAAADALKLVQKGARSEDLRIAEAKVASAGAGLKAAEADQVQVRLKSGAVDIARQQVTAAEKSIQTARAHRIHVEAERQSATQSQARQAAAHGALRSSQVQKQMTVIRAPISGCVVARMIEPGEAADPAAPLLKIANLKTVRVVINVPSDSLFRVRPGQRADILAGNRQLVAAGTITTIGKTVDPATNTVPVWATVPNQASKLSAGQFVDVQIVTTQEPKAVAVPVSAVLQKEGSAVLFAVDDHNVAHQRTVTLGLAEKGFVEISKGVKPGEMIVTEGNYELSDGMKVKPMDSAGKGD